MVSLLLVRGFSSSKRYPYITLRHCLGGGETIINTQLKAHWTVAVESRAKINYVSLTETVNLFDNFYVYQLLRIVT